VRCVYVRLALHPVARLAGLIAYVLGSSSCCWSRRLSAKAMREGKEKNEENQGAFSAHADKPRRKKFIPHPSVDTLRDTPSLLLRPVIGSA
jgi:hypothetical protein